MELTMARAVDMARGMSAYERLVALDGLYTSVLGKAEESPPSADELVVLGAVAREISPLIDTTLAFFEGSAELVREADGHELQLRYEKLFESDQLDPRVHGKVRELIEHRGGIQEYAKHGPEAAMEKLQVRRDVLRQDIERLKKGGVPDSIAVLTVSDDAYFEGGIAAIGIGLATFVAVALGPVSVGAAFALGFAGGFCTTAGAGSIWWAMTHGN